MPKEPIHTPRAPAAIGPYSQAVRASSTIYLSGQIPLDPKTMELVKGDIRAQTRQVFDNLAAVAEAPVRQGLQGGGAQGARHDPLGVADPAGGERLDHELFEQDDVPGGGGRVGPGRGLLHPSGDGVGVHRAHGGAGEVQTLEGVEFRCSTAADPGSIWRLELRPGLVSADGRPLTLMDHSSPEDSLELVPDDLTEVEAGSSVRCGFLAWGAS